MHALKKKLKKIKPSLTEVPFQMLPAKMASLPASRPISTADAAVDVEVAAGAVVAAF
jgi:hypothetical protein